MIYRTRTIKPQFIYDSVEKFKHCLLYQRHPSIFNFTSSLSRLSQTVNTMNLIECHLTKLIDLTQVVSITQHHKPLSEMGSE